MSELSVIPKDKMSEIIQHLGTSGGVDQSAITALSAFSSAFSAYSDWSATHSVRVGIHLSRFLSALGHTQLDASRVGFCACVHDIGKLQVSRSILDKNGPLEPYERDIINDHSVNGPEIISILPNEIVELAQTLAATHHENYDGSGYPHGLKGAEVPDFGQAIRIVDFFDAVSYERPYRDGLGIDGAASLLDKQSSNFNPMLLSEFKANVGSIFKELD